MRVRLSTIVYRLLQILMASTLFMDRVTSGVIVIGLVAAGEVYHWWYAWDRARQLVYASHQARHEGAQAAYDDAEDVARLILHQRAVGDVRPETLNNGSVHRRPW